MSTALDQSDEIRPSANRTTGYVMEVRGWRLHWDRLRHDLDALEEITVPARTRGKTFVIRTRTLGHASKAIQAVGVALGPTLRLLSDKDSG